ncbi:MAG: polyphosphate kinase 1, partial [Eubacteriales bacterium]|nr:polyphosphate kinase 1 [Eubacteriales bacterium]
MEQRNDAVFVNRELSWLKFNERVLEEAESDLTPLCERLSFASIYQSNLDEFFMVRVGSLVDQEIEKPESRENKTNMTAAQQLKEVLRTVRRFNERKDFIYAKLLGHIEENGVRLVDFKKIGKQESERLERYFDCEIAPLISPIIVSRRQPFPFLRNKEIYAVAVLERRNGKRRTAIIPCSSGVFPR